MADATELPAGTIRADDGVVVTPAMLEAVIARIRERLPQYFPNAGFDASSASIDVARLGETSSYPLLVARLRGGGAAREIVIKFAPVFAENNEGLTEYRHLTTLHDRIGDSGRIRVPRPLDFYPDVNALLMERVGGERLSRVILRDASFFAPRAAVARLQSAARLCGEWLAAYHDATRSGEAPPFDDEFVSRVEEKLADFGAHGFPQSAARAVSQTARRLSAFGASRRVPVADRHGDYGPQNVHLGDGHVYVFGLNYHVAAPVYEDIDYFLVTLKTMNPYPRQWFLDRRRVAAMRAPFLRGYFGAEPGEPGHRVLIEGYYLKSLLFRCAKQRRNTARRGRAALAVYDAARVRRYYPRQMEMQCRIVAADLAAAGEGSTA